MSSRRQAREWALQLLFGLDLNPDPSKTPEQVFDEFWNGQLRLREGDDAAGTGRRWSFYDLLQAILNFFRKLLGYFKLKSI